MYLLELVGIKRGKWILLRKLTNYVYILYLIHIHTRVCAYVILGNRTTKEIGKRQVCDSMRWAHAKNTLRH